MKNNAPFIIVDGGEGAGKSTLLAQLKEYFEDRLQISREPGGTPIGESIRHLLKEYGNTLDPRTQLGLFSAARSAHMLQKVGPLLDQGIMVALDRGDSSTFVYQIDALGLEDYKDVFWHLRDFFLNGVYPDLYIYLDVDVELGLERVKARIDNHDGLKHFDEKPVEFHRQLRKGFKEFLARVPHVVIDANRSETEVFAEVLSVLEKRFEWYKVGVAV